MDIKALQYHDILKKVNNFRKDIAKPVNKKFGNNFV